MQVTAHLVDRRADARYESIQRRVHVLKMGRLNRVGFQYSEVGELFQRYRILSVLSLRLIWVGRIHFHGRLKYCNFTIQILYIYIYIYQRL